ncbi:MAG: hypothetical protein SOZ00_03070 [Tidjanibacter sp.]|nr:hypothetical protein [Tidjanibacter sp.]
MKKFIGTFTLILATILSAGAQSVTEIGGEMIGAANMKPSDAARYSQTEHSYMTSRVAAMGGAFTSLGADLSTMSINPAGLGMYRSSEASISGSFVNTNASNSFAPNGSTMGRMSINSAGVALNLFQSSGSLVSVTFGFAYNKLADLNYNQSYSMGDHNKSIADFFAEQLYRLSQGSLGASAGAFNNSDIRVDKWGGVLAYQTQLIEGINSDPATYEYAIPALGADAVIRPKMNLSSLGSVGEYALSSGFNLGNKLYVGFTLGIQDIYQSIEYRYSETYDHQLGAGVDEGGYLRSTVYKPYEESVGTGVNFKIGAIWRPFGGLRLGIAYHTPTAVALNRKYYVSMDTAFNDGVSNSASSLTNSYTYNYNSPSKLLFGASYAIGSRAILSFDYDLVGYNGMRLTGEDYDYEESFRSDVEADYGKATNLRAGIEIRPTKSLYLRGGYALYGSPYKSAVDNDSEVVFYANNKKSTEVLSLGLGLRMQSGSTIDLAFLRSTAKYTNYLLYSFYYKDASQTITADSPVIKNSKQVRNILTATYSFTF